MKIIFFLFSSFLLEAVPGPLALRKGGDVDLNLVPVLLLLPGGNDEGLGHPREQVLQHQQQQLQDDRRDDPGTDPNLERKSEEEKEDHLEEEESKSSSFF